MSNSKIDVLLNPIYKFIHRENTSGLVLLVSVVLAIILANSPLREEYHHLWEVNFSLSLGSYSLSKSLHHWINDGLMSVFFFVIGLELKREFISGELSTLKKASLPIIAALGGMVVPAVIYTVINIGKPGISGWGIPMATDIAFAIALLSLAGNRVPLSLKIFLTALAVVDDLGAVLVIAVFYSSDISLFNLLIGFVFLMILIVGNYLGIRSVLFYSIVGIAGLWLAFLSSGIHATIAGVLVALTIPARTRINEITYLSDGRNLLERFEKEIPLNSSLTTAEQHGIIQEIKQLSSDAETPLQKLEVNLHPWVAFLVMPIFAFANSGIEFGWAELSNIDNSVTLGILAGLVVGKFVGILIFTRASVWLKISALPVDTSWKQIAGVALLAGVGFTMSIFISELAFDSKSLIENAKYGILFASLIAGILGVLVLKGK